MPGRSEPVSPPRWGSSFAGVLDAWSALADEDPEVAGLVANETDRERRTLRLVASENYVSPAVLAASSATLANKYANGYPGKRSYPGCEWVDEAERLAISRAKDLLGGEHVNVQPHSGSQANLAAYLAVLSPGDTMLAFDPKHGGHFTHGRNDNFSSMFFRVEHFGVDRESGFLELSEVARRAEEVRPSAIVVGPTSYPREVDVKGLAEVAREVGARLMIDAAHTIGLTAGGAHADPVPYADIVTFTTHKTLRGPRGGAIICTDELADRVDHAVFPTVQGGPSMSAIAAKAVAFREAKTSEFSAYAKRAVALGRALAQVFEEGGFRVVTGGTDTHIVLLDVSRSGLDGQLAEETLEQSGILANRSRIPYDPSGSGMSGLRFGTAAMATLGMTTEEIVKVGNAIVGVLRDVESVEAKYEASSLVSGICGRLAPYSDPVGVGPGDRRSVDV